METVLTIFGVFWLISLTFMFSAMTAQIVVSVYKELCPDRMAAETVIDTDLLESVDAKLAKVIEVIEPEEGLNLIESFDLLEETVSQQDKWIIELDGKVNQLSYEMTGLVGQIDEVKDKFNWVVPTYSINEDPKPDHVLKVDIGQTGMEWIWPADNLPTQKFDGVMSDLTKVTETLEENGVGSDIIPNRIGCWGPYLPVDEQVKVEGPFDVYTITVDTTNPEMAKECYYFVGPVVSVRKNGIELKVEESESSTNNLLPNQNSESESEVK